MVQRILWKFAKVIYHQIVDPVWFVLIETRLEPVPFPFYEAIEIPRGEHNFGPWEPRSDELSNRLARARDEAEDYRFFDYVVINDDLNETVDKLESIVRAERLRTSRGNGRAQRVLATFPREGQEVKEH